MYNLGYIYTMPIKDYKYELTYLPKCSLPLPEDVVEHINNQINNTEMKREYFLLWSLKTPDTNKIMIGDNLININQDIRKLRLQYEKTVIANGDKPSIYDFISFISFNNKIDDDIDCIKISNKIVCRYFDLQQNKKIKRYIKSTGRYALFYKIMLKSIIIHNIFYKLYDIDIGIRRFCLKYFNDLAL